jgi:hypothetical protein
VWSFKSVYERFARARNATFYGPNGASANTRSFFAREAAGAHEDERFTLLVRKAAQRAREILQIQVRGLRALRDGRVMGRVLVPRLLAPGTTAVRVEVIAQDHEQPGFEIRARFERRAALPRLRKRLLAEIVGLVTIAAKRARKRPQERDQIDQLRTEILIVRLRTGRRSTGLGACSHIHGSNLRACGRSAAEGQRTLGERVPSPRRRRCA